MDKKTLYAILAVVFSAKLAVDHMGDTDMPWHLRLGLDMLQNREFAKSIPYAWTLDAAWPPFDWLGQLAMALAFKPLGFTSLAIGKAILGVALTAAVFQSARLRSRGNLNAAAAAAFLMLYVACNNFQTRPLMLGYAFMALEVLVLEEVRAGKSRKLLLLLPPLFALWGNCHGSWPAGLLPIAVHGVSALVPLRMKFWRPVRLDVLPVLKTVSSDASGTGQPTDPSGTDPLSQRFLHAPDLRLFLLFLATGVLCLAAQFATPAPLEFIARPFRWTAGNTEEVMAEWGRVPIIHPCGLAMALVGMATLWSAFKATRPRHLLAEGIAFASLYAIGFMKIRLVSCLAIMGAPFLAEILANGMGDDGFRGRRRNAAFASVAVVLLGGMGVHGILAAEDASLAVVPRTLVERIADSPLSRERGFNHFDWGGYLTYEKVPVYVDGRLEPFVQAGVFQEYMDVESGGDLSALDARGVIWALVRGDWPLAKSLGEDGGWTLVATEKVKDVDAELWVRREVNGR